MVLKEVTQPILQYRTDLYSRTMPLPRQLLHTGQTCFTPLYPRYKTFIPVSTLGVGATALELAGFFAGFLLIF
jgi:hypothetical protein